MSSNNYYRRQNDQRQPQYRQNQQDNFFNMGGFDMGINDDFDDPFEGMMGGFGFPRIGEIQNRLFGNMQREFDNMRMIGEGMNENGERRGNNIGENQGFEGMFSRMNAGPGVMISKSYCSKVDYRDGKPHKECYQSQSIKQTDKEGHRISERQEAYKNSSTGVQKAAHQRLLDDRGTKQIKQRNLNTGDQEEHNVYKGMQEEDLDNFNKEYNDYRQKVNFQKNYNYLNALNQGRHQLGNGNNNGNRRQNNYQQLGDGRISNQNRQPEVPQPQYRTNVYHKMYK